MTRVAVGGVTTTLATPSVVTVMVACPDFPFADAMIEAVPGPTAVTRPVFVTVATEALLDDHVTVPRLTGTPLPSVPAACACDVWPTMSEVAARLTVMALTEGVLGGVGVVGVTELDVDPPLPQASAQASTASRAHWTSESLDCVIFARRACPVLARESRAKRRRS